LWDTVPFEQAENLAFVLEVGDGGKIVIPKYDDDPAQLGIVWHAPFFGHRNGRNQRTSEARETTEDES
jgi:hypothetical protein